MATGLEIIAFKEGKARLFKVRHDGYAIEDYVDQFKTPQGDTLEEAIKHFKNWFFSPDNYGPEDRTEDGDDIETNYPLGYEFIPRSNNLSNMISQAESELTKMEDEGVFEFEGLTCGYSDYQVLIDLDTKEFKFGEEYE